MAMIKELNAHVLHGTETSIFRCPRSEFLKEVRRKFNIHGDVEIFDRKTSVKLTVDTMKPISSVEIKTKCDKSVSDVKSIIKKIEDDDPLTQEEKHCVISILKSHNGKKPINSVTSKNAKIQVKIPSLDKETQTDKVTQEVPQTSKRKVETNDLMYQCKRLASTEKVDAKKAKELMDKLYDERRSYILLQMPLAAIVKEKYPLLFSLAEVRNEIDRIFHIGKCKRFLDNIDKYAKHILSLVREEDPLLLMTKRKMKSYTTPAQKNYAMKVGSLLIISSIVNEERKFLKLIDQDIELTNFPYIEAQAKFSQIFFDEHLYKIYVEGHLLCEASDFLEAILCLIASYYVFNIKYPDYNWNTFVVLEQIFLECTDTEDVDDFTAQIIRNIQLKAQGSPTDFIRS